MWCSHLIFSSAISICGAELVLLVVGHHRRDGAGVWFPHSPRHLLYGANGSLTLQVSVCFSAKTEVSEYVHTYPSLAFRKLWVQKESSTFKLLQIALSLANEQAHRIRARSHAERKPSVHVHACVRECAWFQY